MAVIRVALWTLPFRVTRSWIDRLRKPAGSPSQLNRAGLREVAWAVATASRRIPGATCLTQGMATQVLLGRLGQISELHLGVARGKLNGQFEAHAWVEVNGCVVSGGAIDGFHRYARLEKTTDLQK